jgi:hypothetical protein
MKIQVRPKKTATDGHKLAVQRLQRWTHNQFFDDDDPNKLDGDAETELFPVRVVADAIGGSIKVVRSLARRRLLESTKRGRFSAGAVIKYLPCWVLTLPAPHYRGCFRSEKIATHPDFLAGLLIPKAFVADSVKLSIRGIERAIKSGELKATKIGKITLVELNSYLEFSFKRNNEVYLDYVLAGERLEAAKKEYHKFGTYPDGVTKDGAARELGVSKKCLESLIKSGALGTFVGFYGKKIFILREDIDKLRRFGREALEREVALWRARSNKTVPAKKKLKKVFGGDVSRVKR